MADVPATLLGLVQAYSPSGHERPAVDFLVGQMQSLGYSRAFVDEAGNAVGLMGEGPRQIVLLGHIDTVPGEIPVKMEGDVLSGRGSVDAKGPLAAFTDAVATTGPLEGWQFIVIGAVGEEKDSDGARFVTPLYHPEYAIIGEPSRWERVTLGYKGSAWAHLTVRRSLAHTAGQGESAPEAAVKGWNAIMAWAAAFNAGRNRAFDHVLPTLRGMDSGSDGLQEWAELQIGTRLPLDINPTQWYEQLAQIPGVDGVDGLSLQPIGFPIPAWQGEKNTPLVRAFLASIRAAGGQPGFVLKTGTADLNIVAPAWKCPALAYGPGDSTLDHTPNERLSLEEYGKAVEVLNSVLLRLTKELNTKGH
jgi:LysW-gamma-L-lysine carboxypeptidase